MALEEIKQLKLLKEKLDNQKMSVLVGAGFSKNVSSIFPSWWQLLFDMTYFLFQSEIEDAYKDALGSKKGTPFKKEDFINDRIEYYIAKNGYLDIVSEYIKRKGYREAITSYIEEKTPNIVNEGKKKFLINSIGGKENKVEIKQGMLSQHKLLLQLPWNNIYTTNYDELLELANDSLTTENIRSEIKTIVEEINELRNKTSKLQRESNRLENENSLVSNEIEEAEEIKETKGDPELIISKISRLEELKTRLNSTQAEKQNLEFNLRGIEASIKHKERELFELRKALDYCISTVTHSSELSVKRNKNIIKLHGSLRKGNSDYGFDGDIQKQYVIAKEDYDTYPVKHEAFTQLMRISLLQESYCLIGFSGDDTNFLEWVKWVREILARGKNKIDDYKIYLISISNSQIPADKQLFFENHRVFPISIMKDEVISFLESHTQFKLTNRTDPKIVIELFLKYLRGKLLVNRPRATFEIVQMNRYKRTWDLVGSPNPNEFRFDMVKELSKNVLELRKLFRIPSLNFAYSNRKHNLLFYSASLLKKAPSKQDQAYLLKLILIAIKDSYLVPTDFIWEKSQLKDVYRYVNTSLKPVREEFLKIRLRECVLKSEADSFKGVLIKLGKRKDDDIKYESILLKAFGFDFKNLKIELNSWNASPEWVVRKAGLLALFDVQEALEYISDKLGSSDIANQEELYMLEMYRYVKQCVHYGFDKDLNESINSYKNVGLTSISENIDYLIEAVNKNNTSLKRYGDGRFSVSNSFTFSNDFTLQQKGLQFIQVLIETGLPLSISHVNWKNHKECYPLFKAAYEHFPYPVIFYALQYSDEKFLRRFGQDFAYSNNLNGLDDILITLLAAILSEDTPSRFKQNILYFTSELFIATEPKTWQGYFLEIWRSETFRKRALEERWFAERTFTKSCIPYIQEPKIIAEFICSLLKVPQSDFAVEFLYHLAKNPVLERQGQSLQFEELEKGIDDLIDSISQYETAIFMVGNVSSILKDSQRKLIRSKLHDLDFKNIKSERIWGVIAHFSNGEEEIIKKLKAAIIENVNLFNAGFTDKGLTSGINFIEISRLTNPHNSIQIQWTKNEAIQVFKAIISELAKIENWLKRGEHDFKFILREMLLFLDFERQKIEDQENFDTVYNKIASLYNKHKGYDALIDGLLSPDSSVVVWALSELSVLLHQKKTLNKFEFEVTTFLNKVLLQSAPSLEECLLYLSSWINNESLSEAFVSYCNTISRILDKYSQFELEEFDKPFVYKQLISIAIKLDDWGVKSENIDKWKEYERQSHFNSIKSGAGKNEN